MTKHVRIENADTSPYKVEVEVWDKSSDPGVPDSLFSTHKLDYPTALADLTIWSNRYLVVKEAK